MSTRQDDGLWRRRMICHDTLLLLPAPEVASAARNAHLALLAAGERDGRDETDTVRKSDPVARASQRARAQVGIRRRHDRALYKRLHGPPAPTALLKQPSLCLS